MISVEYTRRFLRDFSKLQTALQEEVLEKIALFKERANHRGLRVHKLQGRFAGHWSFSVNYAYRIMFDFVGKRKDSVLLLVVGDHSIYD